MTAAAAHSHRLPPRWWWSVPVWGRAVLRVLFREVFRFLFVHVIDDMTGPDHTPVLNKLYTPRRLAKSKEPHCGIDGQRSSGQYAP